MTLILLNQPEDIRFGDYLNGMLQKKDFTSVKLLVGFALSTGVAALKPALEQFLKRGGSVTIIVGVGRRVTSVEGLTLLLGLSQLGASVSIFHNEEAGVIFHPKTYLLEGPNRAVLIVGSNNLTGKGLYENYEMALACEIDPLDPKSDVLTVANKIMAQFQLGSADLCKTLDQALVDSLEKAGYLGSELRGTIVPEEISEKDIQVPEQPIRVPLFGTKPIKRAPRFGKAVYKGSNGEDAEAVYRPGGSSSLDIANPSSVGSRKLLWEKTLSASDAQRTTGNTNPVGGLRLTQAKFKADGKKVIDQTRYFRHDIFQNHKWRTKKTAPFEESTNISAEVRIKGKSIGVRRLEVSHKPSGEAGQGNYTTQLHWGDLTKEIKQANVAGLPVRIYAPIGRDKNYLIQIG